MKLCEHPDFAALLVATAQATGLNEQFVEKDYYVTEVLRIVADAYGEQVIFKGGTSLSKGWALIDRFSEDVDLFVDPARCPESRAPSASSPASKAATTPSSSARSTRSSPRSCASKASTTSLRISNRSQ